MYRPSFDSSLASPQPNQGYSPINSMNLDMDMENLFLSQDLYAGPGFGQGSGSGIHFGHGNQDYYQSQDGSNPVEDDSPIEKVHPSKLRRLQNVLQRPRIMITRKRRNHGQRRKRSRCAELAQGGFNLNEEAKGYEEELQEVRPIGRDRAKNKASSSSRSTSSAIAGGGLVELLKNRELDLQDTARQEAAELKREELAIQRQTLELALKKK
ncbi:hypothetical protein Tco_0848942 [Tanacetum coccineum]